MIDLSERPMYPEIGNCDLFSDARRKTCYERGTISITYSKRLFIFPLQTDSKRYPCEFAFPIRRWRKRRKVTPSTVAPYSTFRLRSLCVNGCLPRSSCVNGCLPNTLLTCQDVPGSHSAFLCRVKGHTQYVVRAEEGEPGNEHPVPELYPLCSSGNKWNPSSKITGKGSIRGGL